MSEPRSAHTDLDSNPNPLVSDDEYDVSRKATLKKPNQTLLNAISENRQTLFKVLCTIAVPVAIASCLAIVIYAKCFLSHDEINPADVSGTNIPSPESVSSSTANFRKNPIEFKYSDELGIKIPIFNYAALNNNDSSLVGIGDLSGESTSTIPSSSINVTVPIQFEIIQSYNFSCEFDKTSYL